MKSEPKKKRGPKKPGRGSRKGGAFERMLCKYLSLWWTQDDIDTRDDVFWRASGSGGRATRRSKKNLETAGSYGDITALHPVGRALINNIVIEAKCGYSSASSMDLLDMPKHAAPQKWEEWIQQAMRSMEDAGAIGWWLITKRDKRQMLITVPRAIVQDLLLTAHGEFKGLLEKSGASMRYPKRVQNVPGEMIELRTFLFDDWFETVKPRHVKDYIWRNGKKEGSLAAHR